MANKDLMDDEALCSTYRSLLGRSRWTTPEMKNAAERDKNGGILKRKRILNACRKYSTLCPYCFDTEIGEGKEDISSHAAEEYTHKSAKAAQTNLEVEKQLREEPLGKLNENVYTHVDCEILYKTEWHTTSHTGTDLGATETKGNDLTHIKQNLKLLDILNILKALHIISGRNFLIDSHQIITGTIL